MLKKIFAATTVLLFCASIAVAGEQVRKKTKKEMGHAK
jgi:hypothetical protein